MALKGVLEVAQQGKDLRTADDDEKALSSLMLLPKIYRIKKIEADSSGDWEQTFAHGRGYPPMFDYYEEVHESWTFEGGYVWYNPKRYSFNGYFNTIEADSTNITLTSSYWDGYIVLYLDPLKFPNTHPSSTGHGGSPRIKVGDDLEGKADYLADLDSKYQTLKVAKKGQFVCNLPSASVPAGGSVTTWFNFNHNLGYAPLYTPFGVNKIGVGLDVAYEGWDNIPTDFVFNEANDLWVEQYLHFDTPEAWENVKIMVDKDKYYVSLQRGNNDHENSKNFPARTMRINYVIFNLPITTEFNLLS